MSSDAQLLGSVDFEEDTSVDREALGALNARSAAKRSEYEPLVGEAGAAPAPGVLEEEVEVVVQPAEPETYELSGIHEILEELHNLSSLLLKKHKNYGGLFAWVRKYDKDVEYSRNRLDRLFFEAQQGLECVRVKPVLAAQLLNKEGFWGSEGYENPNTFVREYETAIETAKQTFNTLRSKTHIPKNERPADVLDAFTALNTANKISRSEHAHEDHDPSKRKFYKTQSRKNKRPADENANEDESLRCRHLRINSRTGDVAVYEKIIKVKIGSHRAKAQENVRKGIVVASALPVAIPVGFLSGPLAAWITPIPAYVSEFVGGALTGIGLSSFGNYVTRDIWLKRTRTFEISSDLPCPPVRFAQPQHYLMQAPTFRPGVAGRKPSLGGINDGVSIDASAAAYSSLSAEPPVSADDSHAQRLAAGKGKAEAALHDVPLTRAEATHTQIPLEADEENFFSLKYQLLACARKLAGAAVNLVKSADGRPEPRFIELIPEDTAREVSLGERVDLNSSIKDTNYKIIQADFTAENTTTLQRNSLNALIAANPIDLDAIEQKIAEIKRPAGVARLTVARTNGLRADDIQNIDLGLERLQLKFKDGIPAEYNPRVEGLRKLLSADPIVPAKVIEKIAEIENPQPVNQVRAGASYQLGAGGIQ